MIDIKNKKDYPLELLLFIKTLNAKAKEWENQNSGLISSMEIGDHGIGFKDIENDNFTFVISFKEQSIHNGHKKYIFLFNYAPQSNHSISTTGNNVERDVDMIDRCFNMWIMLLKEYDQIVLNPDDKIEKFYEKKFSEKFILVDDDANENPFEPEKQILLLEFLESIEAQLKNEPESEEIKKIIEETEELKNSMQKKTKAATVKALSKILAKCQKYSVKLVRVIIETGFKEIIKYGLHEGYNQITHFLSN